MSMLKPMTLGNVTRSRTALALVAATVLVAGTAGEASAKSRHHYRHHQLQAHQADGWLNANASFAPSSGGHSFSGMASFYGNESGSRTASGQRMNASAMTAAHRSL